MSSSKPTPPESSPSNTSRPGIVKAAPKEYGRTIAIIGVRRPSAKPAGADPASKPKDTEPR